MVYFLFWFVTSSDLLFRDGFWTTVAGIKTSEGHWKYYFQSCHILRFIHDRVVALMAHDLLNIWLRFDDDVDLNVATLLDIFQNDWDDIMLGSGLANKDGRLIYFESIWAAKLLLKKLKYVTNDTQPTL